MDVQTETPATPQTPEQAPAAPPQAPPSSPPEPQKPAEPPAEETSIAAHAKKFDPRARDERGQFVKKDKQPDEPVPAAAPKSGKVAQPAPAVEPRRREKDIATPADTPRIHELTRKLREEERRRQQLEEQLRGAMTRSAVPPNGSPRAEATPAASAWAFPKPEPKQADFANAEDPYAAWIDARQDWRLEKRIWEASLEQETATAQQHEQAFWNDFDSKLRPFAEKTPDYNELFAGGGPAHMQEDMPAAMIAMIFMDDNPGQLMYDFARDPALFDEVASWSDAIRIPPATAAPAEREAALAAVSRLRRRLDRRGLQTAVTASVPATPHVTVVPKPPNAVRTGPMRSGDEPPGEARSIADHAARYLPKSRR